MRIIVPEQCMIALKPSDAHLADEATVRYAPKEVTLEVNEQLVSAGYAFADFGDGTRGWVPLDACKPAPPPGPPLSPAAATAIEYFKAQNLGNLLGSKQADGSTAIADTKSQFAATRDAAIQAILGGRPRRCRPVF